VSPKVFLDTNILVYANDAAAGHKHVRALDLVAQYLVQGNAAISTQVCIEYASVAVNKLGQPRAAVEHQLGVLYNFEIVQVSPDLICAGLRLMQAYSLSFWDAVIVAAAQAAHCYEILTEDMADGQMYGPVRAVNPF